MSIRYVSQDLDWSPGMQECVRTKIYEPLVHQLKSSDFEMSAHLGYERKRPSTMKGSLRYELWVVLQTFDGRSNEVVRCQGRDFNALVNEVSSQMRSRLRKKPARYTRFLPNPFKYLPFQRIA